MHAFSKENKLQIRGEILQEKGKLIRTVDGFEIMSDRENEEDSSCK